MYGGSQIEEVTTRPVWRYEPTREHHSRRHEYSQEVDEEIDCGGDGIE